MGTRILSLCVITLVLGMGSLLSACGQIGGSSHADLVSFDALVVNPQQYAGQSLCTTGVQVDGFEAGGLAASTYEKDGYTLLSEPVIWLEGVDLQSREDCTQTDTQPPFEFCRVIACGIFETGGGYGHGGAYAHQLRGRDISANVDSVQIEPKLVSPVIDQPTVMPVPTPDRGGNMPTVQPPPALLEVNSREQISGIGNFCWSQPAGDETGVAVCADMAGIATAEEPLLAIYRYAIRSRMEASEPVLRATVLFDGQRRYEFYSAIPPLAEEEYEAIVSSFRLTGK